ncbi:class I SAM-dependent methyltransferase [Pseudoalteromonas sp. SMS1]|uniref:class I SAM-dependent methyltransferase n=1 Tax=Pseudoalteromonas sp. SMS1 TaxID=2908894 RepID=UPI001F3012BE|nr:class I SAM-dependent methyltransferase [Pseudoalteromonas sp. SMS1]MCF2856176.1 class I SAM-dependent methyltransferase [Pseudoalteromonas sp. SMS1]
MATQYYENNALKLAKIYQSHCFESLHANWLIYLEPYLTIKGMTFLDIGAGAGRDAKFIAENVEQAHVVAVEPVSSLNRLGQAYTRDLPIKWYRDELPCLYQVKKHCEQFDVILVSSVFNYLDTHACVQALLTIRSLLRPKGLLILKLRHCEDEKELTKRGLMNVDVNALIGCAKEADLVCEDMTDLEEDAQGRTHTKWQTLLFKPI